MAVCDWRVSVGSSDYRSTPSKWGLGGAGIREERRTMVPLPRIWGRLQKSGSRARKELRRYNQRLVFQVDTSVRIGQI